MSDVPSVESVDRIDADDTNQVGIASCRCRSLVDDFQIRRSRLVRDERSQTVRLWNSGSHEMAFGL